MLLVFLGQTSDVVAAISTPFSRTRSESFSLNLCDYTFAKQHEWCTHFKLTTTKGAASIEIKSTGDLKLSDANLSQQKKWTQRGLLNKDAKYHGGKLVQQQPLKQNDKTMRCWKRWVHLACYITRDTDKIIKKENNGSTGYLWNQINRGREVLR